MECCRTFLADFLTRADANEGCRYPVDCRCTITPRSLDAAQLIRAHAAMARANMGES